MNALDVATEDNRITEAVRLGLMSERIAIELRKLVRDTGRSAADLFSEGDPPQQPDWHMRVIRVLEK